MSDSPENQPSFETTIDPNQLIGAMHDQAINAAAQFAKTAPAPEGEVDQPVAWQRYGYYGQERWLVDWDESQGEQPKLRVVRFEPSATYANSQEWEGPNGNRLFAFPIKWPGHHRRPGARGVELGMEELAYLNQVIPRLTDDKPDEKH